LRPHTAKSTSNTIAASVKRSANFATRRFPMKSNEVVAKAGTREVKIYMRKKVHTSIF